MKFLTLFRSIPLRIAGLTAVMMLLIVVISQQAIASMPTNTSPDNLWQDVDETPLTTTVERTVHPDRYRVVKLDLPALQAIANQAPSESMANADNNAIIHLPLPYGGYGRFRLIEAPIMEPELAAKFPQFQTFIIQGVDDTTAVGRIDWTHFGFHAIILSTNGTIYIDPYSRADTEHYLVYAKADYTYQSGTYIAHDPLPVDDELEQLNQLLPPMPVGDELRTYRLAVAATGEYTIFHGGTVPDGMAAIVTAINRVNTMYERDLAIRLVLIANNDLVVYTNGSTDPYTNNDGVAMLGQNQSNLDSVIGNANYDVGHVFSTGGGGVASLGVPCRTGVKARGVTGLNSPIGDPFYIDYVAHEMGHQYGANHTFNGNTGSCTGGNRNGSTAFEPGSGTTIMAYAGICGAQNIQPNSDALFHNISINEIRNYTVSGQGNSCPAITATGNTPPVAEAGPSYTIPVNTPFILTGSGTDDDGDALTYTWEQFDLGPAGHPNTPSGNAPIFRVFLPSTEPYRIFPQISDIVNNTQTIGEILPSYARTLTFRLTVRDNHVAPSAGGVNYDSTSVVVSDAAGPFLVTSPNTPVTWNAGHTETVTWDVAGTDQAPVSCANVDLYLSDDGGYTYPHLIVAGVPNTGSAAITVPFVPTTQARVQVICSDNIFFDISNTNFTIDSSPVAVLNISKSVTAVDPIVPGDTLTYTIDVQNNGVVAATATVTDEFPAGLVNPVCDGTPGDLNTTVGIDPSDNASFECTAQADPALRVDISKTVDQAIVEPGTAVTYTITVTNNNALTLTNVIVDDPDVVGCAPALGSAITLAPGASETFVCPNNVITADTTNTATVTAQLEVTNVATVTAPEAPNTPATSQPVSSLINLSASASATVTIQLPVTEYLIFLPVILRNN